MKTKYQIYFQEWEDIEFNWFEADSKLEDKLSKYFNILNIGSKKCKGKKINPKTYLKKLIGKRPIFKKDDGFTAPDFPCSMIYSPPPSKNEVELSQMLWDRNKENIGKLIKLLK